MFPIRDDNPTEITPFFTMAIIAACVAAWVWLQGAGMGRGALMESVCTYGMIPAEVTGAAGDAGGVRLGRGGEVCEFGGLTWATLVSSMFLHGSWMHLLGNMWFLWIFGNNVEDSMGHLRFLLFYVLTGLAAGGAHIVADPGSPIPTVGASGAISAIMGAYVLLYPTARVRTLIVLVVFFQIVDLPAWVMLGYWFLIQLFSGMAQPASATGGVAFWAHIGGFVAGLLLVKPFENPRLVKAKREHRKLGRDEIEHGGWW